jgi:hypothetical protein
MRPSIAAEQRRLHVGSVIIEMGCISAACRSGWGVSERADLPLISTSWSAEDHG